MNDPNVTLTLTREEFDQLMIVLGIAAGSMSSDPKMFDRIMELVNTIGKQSGRPFRPYEIPIRREG